MMREMVSEDVAAAVTRDIEGEAHSFAANLLMPKRILNHSRSAFAMTRAPAAATC